MEPHYTKVLAQMSENLPDSKASLGMHAAAGASYVASASSLNLAGGERYIGKPLPVGRPEMGRFGEELSDRLSGDGFIPRPVRSYQTEPVSQIKY